LSAGQHAIGVLGDRAEQLRPNRRERDAVCLQDVVLLIVTLDADYEA
jgi:hypothetical protein